MSRAVTNTLCYAGTKIQIALQLGTWFKKAISRKIDLDQRDFEIDAVLAACAIWPSCQRPFAGR